MRDTCDLCGGAPVVSWIGGEDGATVARCGACVAAASAGDPPPVEGVDYPQGDGNGSTSEGASAAGYLARDRDQYTSRMALPEYERRANVDLELGR